MIKIGQIRSHLGNRVWSMLHVDCVMDDKREFLVNGRASCPVNYNTTTMKVECPWCHEKEELVIILERAEHDDKLNLLDLLHVDESTREERK